LKKVKSYLTSVLDKQNEQHCIASKYNFMISNIIPLSLTGIEVI